MDPLQAAALLGRRDADANGAAHPRPRTSHPRRPHLVARLRTWRRPLE